MHPISRGLRALVPSLMSLGALVAAESGEPVIVVAERLPLATDDAASAGPVDRANSATPASAVYGPGDGRAVRAGAGWRWR